MRKRRTFVAGLCLWALFLPAVCQASLTPNGWKWYNEPKPRPVRPKEKPQPPPQNTVTTAMSATQQMQWFHQTYSEVLNDATLNPQDKDKYLRLMQLNDFIGNKTQQTGMTFKQLLLEYPQYSYIKDHPVEQAARGPYLELERNKKIDAVRAMRDQGWGFFFVYEGQDPLSQTLAPSIQAFADTYQIELLGLSNDTRFIPALNRNRHNNGKVIVPYTPALILVNPNTGDFKPLAYGFISQSDLLGRFYNAATDYTAADF